MTTPLSSLRQLLEDGIASGSDLADAFEPLSEYVLTTADDAVALAEVTRVFPSRPHQAEPLAISRWSDALRGLVGLYQAVDSREAFDVLRVEGIPALVAIFDSTFSQLEPGVPGEELLFLLKVAAMYRVEEALDRIVAAARRPLAPSAYLWVVLFAVFDEDHPFRLRLFNALRNPLLGGFVGIAYLDFANAILREGHALNHPFDTEDGRARLRTFHTNPDQPSYAQSAAAALPFIARPDRDALLALAMDHPSGDVQLEAAWAAGRLGSDSAIKFLARACLDPRSAKVASSYLSELGQEHRIPTEARDPEFQALAEMAEWLAHPNEFGRVPDALEVVESRELAWPPSRDHRRLWLVRYRYESSSANTKYDEGVGCVGSLTFALFGEATADLSPDDLYALYCCWELEVRGDSRAPRVRSVEAGRAILERAQVEGPDVA